MSKWWTADFETTGQVNYEKDGFVRVWLWSLCGVEDEEVFYGFDIQSFLETVKKNKIHKVFFHNLRFDGKFIVDYLIRSGEEYERDFTTIIDGLGSWYEVRWKYGRDSSVKFWDSLKKFPGTSVEMLGKFVGLNKKDKPNFAKYYPSDYKPTQQEIDYCIRDSQVVAKALLTSLQQGFVAMTLASDCFKSGKDRCLRGRFYRDYFPEVAKPVHDFCNKGYRGGVSYLKPEYEDIEVNDVKVFDVNSLYPWVMHDCPLPIGYGFYTKDKPLTNTYFVKFKTQFAVKNNKFPFLQIKGSLKYLDNQFIKYSNGTEELTLTSVDYKNFKNNYKVLEEYDHEYISFNTQVGLLAPHVDYWMSKKKEYEKMGLPFMRYIAKTMMNGFYGKTAMRTERVNVVPVMDEETNKISYSTRVSSEIPSVYLPYGAFVTAFARDKLINSALKVWKDFIYCDTDSIHCFDSNNIPLDIHQTDLGKWKDETINGAYPYAKYIKQKTYCHAIDGLECFKTDYGSFIRPGKEIVEIRAAGLNTDSRKGIPFSEFKYGLLVQNANLKMKTVPGGAMLVGTDWKLENEEDEIEKFLIGDLDDY